MDHLYFVVHTHWDREWYEPFQRMRARLVAMTDRMLTLVEEGKIPCFHFDGQTIVLEDYLEVRPENARRIAKLVKDGRIQIGPWYVLAGGETGPFRCRCGDRRPKPAESFAASGRPGYTRVGSGESNGNPGLYEKRSES